MGSFNLLNILFITVTYDIVYMNSQLVVNVKNDGGEIIREAINANTTLDTIILEFEKSDGTQVTELIDFKNEVHIFRAIVLGEEERGQHQHQVMCFIVRLIKNEFISSDAMSKLRQKNPSAIRHPEDDKGKEDIQLDLLLNLAKSGVISPHIQDLCHDAPESTYARDADLKLLSKVLNKDYTLMLGAAKRVSTFRIPRCSEVHEPWRSCACQYFMCVGWYPCGLKYCRGKDSSGKVVSYRCGIKTCKKCRMFEYFVRQKMMCIWDEV